MANGRLLEDDRTWMQQSIPWGALRQTYTWPLSPQETYDLYMDGFGESRSAYESLLANSPAIEETMNYVEKKAIFEVPTAWTVEDGMVGGKITVNVWWGEAHGLPPMPTNNYGSMPEGWRFPEHWLPKIQEFVDEVARTEQIMQSCIHLVDKITGWQGINTYGQLARVWPDIIRIAPAHITAHVKNAKRTSRLPNHTTDYEWSRIRKALDIATDYALQAKMLEASKSEDNSSERAWASSNVNNKAISYLLETWKGKPPITTAPVEVSMPWEK